MTHPKIEQKISLGEMWQMVVTIVGGLVAMGFFWATLNSSIANAQKDITRNKEAIEEIADLKEIVIELKTAQKVQNKQIDFLVDLLKEKYK